MKKKQTDTEQKTTARTFEEVNAEYNQVASLIGDATFKIEVLQLQKDALLRRARELDEEVKFAVTQREQQRSEEEGW